MAENSDKDPSGGFKAKYDADTEVCTISIHRYVLSHPEQHHALANKLVETFGSNPNAKAIVVIPRDSRSDLPCQHLRAILRRVKFREAAPPAIGASQEGPRRLRRLSRLAVLR